MPPIFEKFPNAEGFLFLKDDVILNYWALLAADKNKLWSLHKVTFSTFLFYNIIVVEYLAYNMCRIHMVSILTFSKTYLEYIFYR